MSARILMMNISTSTSDDPLGLRDLPGIGPEAGRMEDDWAVVQAALDEQGQVRRQRWLGGLAAAAVLAVVVLIARMPGSQAPELNTEQPSMVQQASEEPANQAQSAEPGAEELMAMSQGMERQLRFLRDEVDGLPPGFLIYQVELQDLISQVDDAISLDPESEDLWGQRLGLQMDLMKLYRSHLRRDHSGLASL